MSDSESYSDDFDDASSGSVDVLTTKARVTVLTLKQGHHYALRIDDKIRVLHKCLEEAVGSLDGQRLMWNGVEIKDDEMTLKLLGIGDHSILALIPVGSVSIIPGSISTLLVILAGVAAAAKQRSETPEGRKIVSFMQRWLARKKLERLAFSKVIAWDMNVHKHGERAEFALTGVRGDAASLREVRDMYQSLRAGKRLPCRMFNKLVVAVTLQAGKHAPCRELSLAKGEQLAIVGDLKADLASLGAILQNSDTDNIAYLFNGSLTSEGAIEVLLCVLCLHLLAPSHVFLTRACADEHGTDVLLAGARYGRQVANLVQSLRSLPLMYVVNSKVAITHSGVPAASTDISTPSLEEHATAILAHEPSDALVASATRSATACGTCGDTYGVQRTKMFLEANNLSYLIRSHSTAGPTGHSTCHGGLVHTVWSAGDFAPGLGGSYLIVNAALQLQSILISLSCPPSYHAARDLALSVLSQAIVGLRPQTLAPPLADWVTMQSKVSPLLPWRSLWRDLAEGSTMGQSFSVSTPSVYQHHLRLEATWVAGWAKEAAPLLETLGVCRGTFHGMANGLAAAVPQLPTETISYFMLHRQLGRDSSTCSACFLALWQLYKSSGEAWDALELQAVPYISVEDFIAFCLKHCTLIGSPVKSKQQVAMWRRMAQSMASSDSIEWCTLLGIITDVDELLVDKPVKMANLFRMMADVKDELLVQLMLEVTEDGMLQATQFIKVLTLLLGVDTSNHDYLRLWRLLAGEDNAISSALLARHFDVMPARQAPSLVFRREWRALPSPSTVLATCASVLGVVVASIEEARRSGSEQARLVKRIEDKRTETAKHASEVLKVHSHVGLPSKKTLSLGTLTFTCNRRLCTVTNKASGIVTRFTHVSLVPNMPECTVRVCHEPTGRREVLTVPRSPTPAASVLRLWQHLDSNKMPHNIGLQFATPQGAVASNASYCRPYNVPLASLRQAVHTLITLLKTRHTTVQAAWEELGGAPVAKVLNGLRDDLAEQVALVIGTCNEDSTQSLFLLLTEADKAPKSVATKEPVKEADESSDITPHIKETIHGLAYSIEADEMYKLVDAVEKAEKKVVVAPAVPAVGAEVRLEDNSIGTGTVIKVGRAHLTVRFNAMMMNVEKAKVRVVRREERLKLLNELAHVEYNRASLGVKKSKGCYVLGHGVKATPLMYACMALRKHTVEWLLSNGADPSVGCAPCDGITPKYLCAVNKKAAAAAAADIEQEAEELQLLVTEAKKAESIVTNEVLALQQKLKEAVKDKENVAELEKQVRGKEDEEKKAERKTEEVEQKHKEKHELAERTKLAGAAYARLGKMLQPQPKKGQKPGGRVLIKTHMVDGKVELTDATLETLVGEVKKGVMTTLNLGNIHLPGENLRALLDAAKEGAVQELNLRACGLDEDAAYDVAKLVLTSSALTALYLWNNNLGRGGMVVVEALKAKRAVRCLDLTLTGMDSEECAKAQEICRSLNVTLFVDRIPMPEKRKEPKEALEAVMKVIESKKGVLASKDDEEAEGGADKDKSKDKDKEKDKDDDEAKKTEKAEEGNDASTQKLMEKKEQEEKKREEREKEEAKKIAEEVDEEREAKAKELAKLEEEKRKTS